MKCSDQPGKVLNLVIPELFANMHLYFHETNMNSLKYAKNVFSAGYVVYVMLPS